MELKGSSLTNALGSESPGDAIHLKFANSVAHSAVDTNIDERDPYFARRSQLQDWYEMLHLKALEGSILSEEWRTYLAKCATSEGSNEMQESVADADGDTTEQEVISPSQDAEAAFSNLRRKKTAQLLKRARREARLEAERAAAGVTLSRSQPLDWSDYTSWKNGPPEDGGGVDLSCWHDRHHMYENLGYGATVTTVAQELRRYWSGRAQAATNLSSGERRAARRESRLQEGGTYYLAIEPKLPKPQEKCAASGGAEVLTEAPAAKSWSSDVKKMEEVLSLHASANSKQDVVTSNVSPASVNVSDDVYSAIDSGTTLTIMDLADGTKLDGFNPEASVKIMGFNGSVSCSRGRGTAVGFGTARDGHRVTLRVPEVHNLPGAPNDLLSVSAMVALGYQFHFTPTANYIVTPEMDVIDIVERAGLYWLKWKKAVSPAKAASHAASDPAISIVEAPVASDPKKGQASPNMSSESHASSSDNVEDVPSWTRSSEIKDAMVTGETKKQTLGAEEAYTTNPSMSKCLADQSSHEASLEEEYLINDGRARDDSYELNHMELTAGHVADGDVPNQDHLQGAAEERLKFLFDPATETVDNCGDKRCFTCCSGSRVKESKVPLQLLHRRLGHFDSRIIERMVDRRAIDVMLSDRKMCECAVCKAVKATRRPVPKQREHEVIERKPWERVWTDLKGKVCKDFWGNQYMVTFTDELTRYSYVAFCQRKSQVKERFVEFLNWVKLQGHRVRLLNSDGGGEYTSNENAHMASEFTKICRAQDIEQQFTSAHTPSQNGIAERLNRTLVEHASCLLHEAGLAKEFWSFAVKHVVWIRNRFHHSSLEDKAKGSAPVSPFERLHGRPPRVAMARVFGCDAWALDHSYRSGTFEPRAQKGIFVGVSANRKGWVIFFPNTRKCRTTFHASFDESLVGRRCWLRDFTLRQSKAGPGATRDEERLANLERELYQEHVDLPFEDATESSPGSGSAPSGGVECRSAEDVVNQEVEDAQEAQIPNSRNRSQIPPAGHKHDFDDVGQDSGERMPDFSAQQTRSRRQNQNLRDEGSANADPPTRTPVRVVIPERRAAIGQEQEMSDEDNDFLRYAFEYDVPMEMQQRNPKRDQSKSRARYEKYKLARTLREAKEMGAQWGDLLWDYKRGYIDFRSASANVTIEQLEANRVQRGVSVSPAAMVDETGKVIFDHPFGGLTFEESIQQDYAVMAMEHIEDMSHRDQRILQRALVSQTLTNFAHCCASRIMVPEPLSVSEALASEHAAEWRAAMDEEIENLKKFQCFKRVPRSEALKHGRLVKSKWVFKVKYNSDNTIQRFRARLVAKGFTQVPGSDYYETFSPVFSHTSFRSTLALAAAYDMRIDIWDLKNGFIQQKIDVEHMYMECPDGYSKLMDDGSPAALHCLRSIYGLRQSSMLLHERLTKHLSRHGFKQLKSDKCVYVKGEGASRQILLVWVDDIILATARDDDAARKKFDADLRSEFEVSPWTSGEANFILGMNVKRDWEAGTLHLSQPGAIEKLAMKFDLTGKSGRAPSVPMDPALKLRKTPQEFIVTASTFDYQSAVGGLLYIALTARPDVAQAVGVLSRFMSCPGQDHVEATKQVIRYLFATKDYGITYSRGAVGAPHLYLHARKTSLAVEDPLQDSKSVIAYADADLAGDEDTRKSTTGFALLLHGGVVSWMSKLQPTVALSTAEAETIAGVEAVKQIMHLRLFLRELDQEQLSPTTVWEDNNAAIALAHGKEQSKRAKHYQMKVAFLNEQHQRGVFSYEKVGTKEQLGDQFTKALPRDDFCRYRDWMGVRPPSTSTVNEGGLRSEE